MCRRQETSEQARSHQNGCKEAASRREALGPAPVRTLDRVKAQAIRGGQKYTMFLPNGTPCN